MTKKPIKKQSDYYYKMCNNQGTVSIQIWEKGINKIFGKGAYICSLGTASNLIKKLERLKELETQLNNPPMQKQNISNTNLLERMMGK
jgi:hypothetical protein